ncbi:MAG: hypothetical protein AAFY91_06650 [Bacteroidota bacterium]
MIKLTAESQQQFDTWKSSLETQGFKFVNEGYPNLKTTRKGAASLGVTPKRKWYYWPVRVVLALVALVWLFGLIMDPGAVFENIESDEPEISWQDEQQEIFNGSDFRVKYRLWIKEHVVRNPSTYRMLDYTVINVEPDSAVIVSAFSAENDFGVRQERSITIVADMATKSIARVVSLE